MHCGFGASATGRQIEAARRGADEAPASVKPHYAGFFPRLAAGFIDFLAWVPLIALEVWLQSLSWSVAVWTTVPFAVAYAAYQIYFIGRWGQTLGKMALRIKVVRLNGDKVDFTHAFYRHAVDLGFALLITALSLTALFSIAAADYDARDFAERMLLVAEHTPRVSEVLDYLYFAWLVSELVVLLFNEKRRALHDFIAGTVVIHVRGGTAASI